MGHSSINVSLTYLRGLEIAELKEEDINSLLLIKDLFDLSFLYLEKRYYEKRKNRIRKIECS